MRTPASRLLAPAVAREPAASEAGRVRHLHRSARAAASIHIAPVASFDLQLLDPIAA